MVTEHWSDSSRQRAYEAIKARIVAHELPGGERILVEPLADKLFVSNTPVREALIQLVAERLIKDVPKAGFFTKEISEAEIRGLYILNQVLLDWSLSVTRNDGGVPGMLKPPETFDTSHRTSELSALSAVKMMDELFAHIAMQSGNADVIHQVGNINERTYFLRLKECELIADVPKDLLRLCETYFQRDLESLRPALQRFHDKRLQLMPGVIRLIRQSGTATNLKNRRAG